MTSCLPPLAGLGMCLFGGSVDNVTGRRSRRLRLSGCDLNDLVEIFNLLGSFLRDGIFLDLFVMGIDNDLVINNHVPLVVLGNNLNVVLNVSVLWVDLDWLNSRGWETISNGLIQIFLKIMSGPHFFGFVVLDRWVNGHDGADLFISESSGLRPSLPGGFPVGLKNSCMDPHEDLLIRLIKDLGGGCRFLLGGDGFHDFLSAE